MRYRSAKTEPAVRGASTIGGTISAILPSLLKTLIMQVRHPFDAEIVATVGINCGSHPGGSGWFMVRRTDSRAISVREWASSFFKMWET
jgi:hypothetical protein